MTIEAEIKYIKRMLQQLLDKSDTPKWVSRRVVKRELNLTDDEIRGIRVRYENVARRTGSKRFEYNLTELRKYAA